jgi:hypothetical protein
MPNPPAPNPPVPNTTTLNTPAPPYPLVPGPVERSWLDRHARWKIPLGCLIVILLLCAFVGVTFTILDVSFRSSLVYHEALARARQSSEVANHIGSPLKPGRVIQGHISVSGSTGNANMEIPLTGPRGKATIVLDASKVDGKWAFRMLEVQFEGQSNVVNLLKEAPITQQ